ncbi:hypothetical protein E4534_16600, partial [Escherichia coli]|nr:hypothetical protein [Escherichia coli]
MLISGQLEPSVQRPVTADPEGFLPRATGAPGEIFQGFLLPLHQHHICSIDAYTFAVNCTVPALTVTHHNRMTRQAITRHLSTNTITSALTTLIHINRKRTARAVLTGMCYSAGSAMRHGSSSLTRLTGQ